MSDLQFMTPSAQSLELRRCDAAHVIPFWPRWMCTRWGQWLARHFVLVARLWRAEVVLAELREVEAREAQAALDAMVGLQLWAEDGFPEEMGEAVRQKLIGSWCKWRTHHERKCECVKCKPIGSLEWIEAQKFEFEKGFQQ